MHSRSGQKNAYGEEAKLALGLIEVLKKQGYRCYPELDRVDIVAVRDSDVIAIECKKSLDLKVLAQAHQHRRKATATYIAIPASGITAERSCARFARDACCAMNMGCFTVSYDYRAKAAWATWQPGDPVPAATVTGLWIPRWIARRDLSWDQLLVPEGETYSVAGGSGVKAWTAIRIWELEVKRWVHENPGQTVGDILRALRPPGTHKKTGKPLVVHKQDQERLFYFIKNVFRDFHTVAGGLDFSTSRIHLGARCVPVAARPLIDSGGGGA